MKQDQLLRLNELRKKNADADMFHNVVSKQINDSIKFIHDTPETLDNLDQQFCQKTGLTQVDMTFLFTAIGLQIARQYLLTKFPERLPDGQAANNTKGHHEEHSNRHHRYYNPSFEEIRTNPVPFDANVGADGALSGGGKLGHRVTAIGHDPLLGLIFGTANIATSTLTNMNFDSYHISTNINKHDYFKSRANTGLVLQYTADKMLHQGSQREDNCGLFFFKRNYSFKVRYLYKT